MAADASGQQLGEGKPIGDKELTLQQRIRPLSDARLAVSTTSRAGETNTPKRLKATGHQLRRRLEPVSKPVEIYLLPAGTLRYDSPFVYAPCKEVAVEPCINLASRAVGMDCGFESDLAGCCEAYHGASAELKTNSSSSRPVRRHPLGCEDLPVQRL